MSGDIQEMTVAACFQGQAARTPHNIAVKVGEREVTYAELNEIAARIAGAVYAGDKSECPVAILMDEGPFLIAAILAVLALGRPFIPLEARLPEARIAAVLSASGASQLLTDSARSQLANRLASATVEIINVDIVEKEAASFHGVLPTSPYAPACIIYTSGSTGKPKGVVISHAHLLRSVTNRTRLFEIRATDRFAYVRSVGSSASINVLLLPLLNGSTLCMFDLHREGLQNLGPWMVAENTTVILLTCSLLRTWVASLAEDFRMPSLRLIGAGSESLYGSDVALAARHLEGDWKIFHYLSSTETSLATSRVMGPNNIPEPGILHVGFPVEEVEISLAPEPETQAQGASEIVVRGRYISLGYWNEPELTAAAFTADPLDKTIRTYRTGDLGRWRPDGSLEYLGRKTRKIKLSGYSVEPYEIENALLHIKGVRDAAVIANGAQTDRHLVAYVAAGNDAALTQAAVRQHIGATLPRYMMPRHIVIMESFPLTTRGKVDLSALPLPESSNDNRRSYRAPQTEQERVLSSIWQEILQRPLIGIEENFYDLGGTSLQAFVIFARIASALGQDLPPTTMLEAPTIAKQAALLAKTHSIGPIEQLVAFRREGAGPPLFVVHGAYGDIMFAREIVRDLRSSRPVYGLQPPPLDGRHKLPRTMEAIASGYLAEVRKVQPRGPYFLAGYSFGGATALEMAQQLTRCGETVAFLGLIDTSLGGRYEFANEDAVARVGRHLRQMRSKSLLPYVSSRLHKTLSYYTSIAARTVGQLPNELRVLTGRPIPYGKRAEYYQHMFVTANRRYRTKAYDGAIVVFSAKGRSDWHRARWSSVAQRGFSVYEVPADHFDLVWPPHSTLLAQHFDAALASASG